MAKRRTKTQQKRMYEAIEEKARKLSRFRSGPLASAGKGGEMSLKDYTAIRAICAKYLKQI